LTGLYAGEVPLARPLDSTFHYEALGGEVSLRTPGLLVASPAFIVPAVSFRRVGGEGAATVTDPGPRPNVLSTTSSWTSTSSILGFDWFLGYEWKAVTLTGKAGVDFVVFEDVRSDEFGSRGGNSTHAYTLGADLFARLVEGFGLHVDVGFWYWDVIQPAGYVYTGPTATVAPAKGVARWDVNASAGVGYAFSL
jgi:hypothetical protein